MGALNRRSARSRAWSCEWFEEGSDSLGGADSDGRYVVGREGFQGREQRGEMAVPGE